ncbi:hypothetical protein BCV69DRAFT_125571 [Microstroma glucosiphilum]|uniref:Uncharacterized protein n=1 Tax=Pseudomicrostroma glucosiphilum TaxID=1684307 RepID=A0A316TWL4_9BASI|nr:hypothetical protein BCV69DRAFT_125571 [Pseudomicrostroma glucosiphilum]PWN17862.1 hypothetical protein BCV69DRAFT_125571 [Pseudomicrostroma glucosiphilum]
MRPGLGARLPLSTTKIRPFSTGPVRPPSHSSKPTPSPRPVPPTPQPLPPRPTPQAAAAAAPSRPDVPKFVYIVGGGVIVLGLAVIWILPGEFTTLTTEKLNHSRLSGSSASSMKADSWSTLPILQSIYAVSPSNRVEVRGWIKSWDESWMKSLADIKSGLGEIVLLHLLLAQ